MIIRGREKVISIHGGREKVIWAGGSIKVNGAGGRGPKSGAGGCGPKKSNTCIGVCVKEKERINHGVGDGLEIPAEYIFYGNEKATQWAKGALDGLDGNVKKKSLKMFKIKSF